MDNGQVLLRRRGPDGLQVGVVQGLVDAGVGPDSHGPGRVAPGLDLQHRVLHSRSGHGQVRLEPAGVLGAEVVHEAVIGPVHGDLDGRVSQQGETGGHVRHHGVNVGPLLVHVRDASVHSVVDDPYRGQLGARIAPKVKPVVPILGRLRRPRLTEHTPVGRQPHVVVVPGWVLPGRRGLVRPRLDPVLGQLREPWPELGVEVGLQRLHGGVNVRIRIVDPVAVPHCFLPSKRAPQRPPAGAGAGCRHAAYSGSSSTKARIMPSKTSQKTSSVFCTASRTRSCASSLTA